jgi:hypothetical protein
MQLAEAAFLQLAESSASLQLAEAALLQLAEAALLHSAIRTGTAGHSGLWMEYRTGYVLDETTGSPFILALFLQALSSHRSLRFVYRCLRCGV